MSSERAPSHESKIPICELLERHPKRFSLPIRFLAENQKKALQSLYMTDSQAEITDRTLLPVPEKVVAATELVTQTAQEKFLTWLPDYLQGSTLLITAQDRERHPSVNFEECLRVIDNYRDSLLTIDTTSSENLEQVLQKIRAAVAKNRIMRAVVKKETQGVSQVLFLGAGISGIQLAYQEARGLTPVVYAIAGSVDNFAAMSAEVIKLRKQGFSLKQAVEAMKWPLVLLVTSWGLAKPIDQLFDAGIDPAAGALYGAESGICVTPSVGAAISMRENYKRLVSEGKTKDDSLEKLLEKEKPTKLERIRIAWLSSWGAFKHDLIYPHHVGLIVGSLTGIILSTLTATISTSEERSLLQHPFVISPLGITDSVGGAIGGTLADKIYNIALNRELKKLAKSSKLEQKNP